MTGACDHLSPPPPPVILFAPIVLLENPAWRSCILKGLVTPIYKLQKIGATCWNGDKVWAFRYMFGIYGWRSGSGAGLSFGVSGFSVVLSVRHASATISDVAFCETRVQEAFGSIFWTFRMNADMMHRIVHYFLNHLSYMFIIVVYLTLSNIFQCITERILPEFNIFCGYIMTLFLQCIGCRECTNFPKV